jgi:hypothetical protein
VDRPWNLGLVAEGAAAMVIGNLGSFSIAGGGFCAWVWVWERAGIKTSGWGEQTILDRAICADRRCRFNFPVKFVPL